MSSPALVLADSWDFTELWVDPTASLPYVLILLCAEAGHCSIYDPAQNYQIVFTTLARVSPPSACGVGRDSAAMKRSGIANQDLGVS